MRIRKKADMGLGFSLFLSILLVVLIVFLIILLKNPKMTGKIMNEPKQNNEPEIIYEYGPEPVICFTLTQDCERFLIDYIKNANNPGCAFYDLNLKNISDYLLNNNASVVIEDSTYDGDFVTFKSYGLMHNKFCFDNESIITGSMNPTYNDAFRNNNNFIIIESKTLAQNYAGEFGELNRGINGKGAKVKTPVILLNNKTLIKNYFCPDDDCSDKVLNELKKANSSIYFMTFSFTDDSIGDYLISKKESLEIKGIFEKQQLSNYSEYGKMKLVDMGVITDKNKYKLHHKVFIIDNTTMITGSYNPTSNADSNNDENILIITDKEIASEYLEEFELLFN